VKSPLLPECSHSSSSKHSSYLLK